MISDEGPVEDRERRLVGAVVRNRCSKGEEDIGDPKECEGEDKASDGVADRPELPREGAA